MAKSPKQSITKLSAKQIKELESKLKQFVGNVKSHRGIMVDKLLEGHGSHAQQ